PIETFLTAGKGSRREIAVVIFRVPTRLDAAHVRSVFIDVMRNAHCGVPVCSTVAEFVALQHPGLCTQRMSVQRSSRGPAIQVIGLQFWLGPTSQHTPWPAGSRGR